ncbi:sialate O-acetylesterase [Tuwongella immobilis]|uniref:Sialate O-acetylesterase domain-containing protein n=1 Tax=Tuwongella immobilis TaxID=692036 RepID=A0A6C2YU17_9BACT|nr:sialate O-acetylesterase [Tuwongella immobilis]VIP05130.1 Sialate O-acetylesterase OS=Isosphaera pallida (strain ATCC 43644 / DSM 9630 / IS1B) GN=Isop_1978 PE=4 SV=1: DUF303 [Tuwongella immobilis]VTS07616.1 Sialate O-acetylesterase OS=Isosphaera pallida (strain ATCC 43644 / DSM 9630 / IS1B) GN=Isop_1978 PE=4 SV=1: DUF303 [Tuwongella immobilis]
MHTRMKATLLALAAGVSFALPASAAVKLHNLISNGVVFQAEKPIRVFGTANPGEKVSAELTFGDATTKAEAVAADDKGNWLLELPARPVTTTGGKLTVKGENTLTVSDVLVGEVWVCSGQSNMEWPLAATDNPKPVIEAAKNPMIRLFTVPKAVSDVPLTDVPLKWVPCDAKTVEYFSAVGYYFGKDLNAARKVPVGLIHSSWGGTICEAWTSKESLGAVPSLKYFLERIPNRAAYQQNAEAYLEKLEKYLAEGKAGLKAGKPLPPVPVPPAPVNLGNPNQPTVLYNAMIAPLTKFNIKGAIWYQGESNAGRAYEYRTLFPTMIEDWRKAFRDESLAFMLVQLAPWRAINAEPMESDWAELREAQLLATKKLKHVGIAVITDVGDVADIHPRKKGPVGARLALAARALAYGEKIPYQGPTFEKLEVRDGKAIVHFGNTEGKLVVKGEKLTGFTVAGADKKFYNATAVVEGDTVVVSAPQVSKPVAVRFGWANFPVVNLWNQADLPASPFRTDDFRGVTQPAEPKK